MVFETNRLDDASFVKTVYEKRKLPKDVTIEDVVGILEEAGGLEQLLDVYCGRGKKYAYETTTGFYFDKMGVDFKISTAIHGKLENVRRALASSQSVNQVRSTPTTQVRSTKSVVLLPLKSVVLSP